MQATVDLLIQVSGANRQGCSFSMEPLDMFLMALNAFNRRRAERQFEGVFLLSR